MENNLVDSKIKNLVKLFNSGIDYKILKDFINETIKGSIQPQGEYRNSKSIEDWKNHFAEMYLSDLKTEDIALIFKYLRNYYKNEFLFTTEGKYAIAKKVNYNFLTTDSFEYLVLQTLSEYDSIRKHIL